MNYKIKIYLFLGILLFINSANAQLKVNTNGKTFVGKAMTDDPLNSVKLAVYGPNGDLRTGSKLSFGDFGTQVNNSWNVFLGEYTDGDTDQLWLHGKLGFYFTYGNATNKTIAYYDPNIGNKFNFNCEVWANGVKLTSDKRLKNNINNINNSLPKLLALQGVSYTLKSTTTNTLSMPATVSGSLTEKEIRDKAFFEKWDREQEMIANTKKHIGFIAQDLREVFPELVDEDKNGYLSVDYIGLIPVIVESMKEMQSTIEQQNQKISELETYIADNAPRTRSVSDNPFSTPDAPKLFDCTPNPFKSQTEIRYMIPTESSNSQICIYNMVGELKRKFDLRDSNGKIVVSSTGLNPGMFLYALIVDGKVIDTKKMVVAN